MDRAHEIGVLFAAELRRTLRSAKGLTLLSLYALANLLSGLAFIWATRAAEAQVKALAEGKGMSPDAALGFKRQLLGWFYGTDSAALLDYLQQIPSVVLFFFATTLFFLPLLTLLMGFDQISGELSTRSIRYVALRARRSSIVLGKFLGQGAALFAVTAAANLAVFLLAAFATEHFPLGAGLLGLLHFWAATLTYSGAYLGLTSLCSSLFRSPILSLLAGLCALLGLVVLHAVGSHSETLAFLQYLVPGHYKTQLLAPSLLATLPALGIYALFASTFLAASCAIVRLRDL